MTNTLENLVEAVGGFGKFQILLLFLSVPSIFVTVWAMLFLVFGVVEPDWWCASPDLRFSQSTHRFLNTSYEAMDMTGANGTFSINVQNQTGVLKNCGLLKENGGVCENIVFAPGMKTIVTEFQLICNKAWIPVMIFSLQMIGVVIGAIIAGQLADTIGRRKSMLTFITLHALFNLIAAFSMTWQMFAVFRTLIGSTTGGILVSYTVYPMEFIGVKHRAVFNSIPSWGLGAVTCSLLVWVLPHWSHVHLVTAACTALCLPAWIFLPESVRWLMVKGHMTQAQRVLERIAWWNNRKVPSLDSMQLLFSDIEKPKKKYSYIHIFSSVKLLRYSVLNGLMWFCCSVTYYGISFGIKNLSGDFHLNFFLMTVVELPASMCIYHLSGWIGRRRTVMGSFAICSLALLAVVPLSLLLSEEDSGNYVNAMCLVCRIAMNLGWNAMTLLLNELFPTVVRNIALAYCNTLARLGGILAPYILSSGELYKFFIIIGVAMALSSLAPLFLPETRGKPLQDELHESSGQKHKTNGVRNMKKQQELIDVNDDGSVQKGLV